MEKIKEYWDHNSVTTVFRISHTNGHLAGCKRDNFTNDCGLGWNFSIAHASPGENCWERGIEIFFRFTDEQWLASYGTSLTLIFALLPDTGEDTTRGLKSTKTVTIPTPAGRRVLSWPNDIISCPRISIKITFGTVVDVDGMMKQKNAPKTVTPVISSALQMVLHRAFLSGVFFDTKFLASSCPKETLYAHSAVLDAAQPALLRLCSNSSTPNNAPIDDTEKESPRDLEYDISIDDYDSDSDFDETEFKDEPDAGASDALIEERMPHNHPGTNTTLREPPPAYHPTRQNVERTIRVQGVALKTLKALINYCYTAQIHFNPLRSSGADKAKDEPLSPHHFRCSPKSMYRLADKIGAEELKKLALESIRFSLYKHNILDEVFSHFTSRYPEVLNMELDLLVKNIREPKVAHALPGKMTAVVSGAFPHSGKILTELAKRAK
ncbi:hypothetical protein BJ138DRAFT_353055 [Hygrophoropsis aurantiaca]|uniref:Uncharacterized protein n=1 Tax=Hygrophoropsis aurantiaca TaxID=72124 RepID=A0ACB8A5I0_9AGAM|nr:hypothetical protein BJ138DRAFT_353055 [Hygrophoropsis aurantiaca]